MACLGSLLHLHTSSCCEGRLTTVCGTCKSSQISSTFPQINGVNILFKFGVNILPILLSKCQSVVPMLRCLILYTVMISFPDWELPLKYTGAPPSSIMHSFIHKYSWTICYVSGTVPVLKQRQKNQNLFLLIDYSWERRRQRLNNSQINIWLQIVVSAMKV